LALYYGLRNLQVSHIQAIGGGLHESLIPESVKNKDLWLHNGKDDPHFSEEKIMILEKTLSARGARVSQRNFNAKHEVSSEMMEELLIALGE
jgi:predicted esterase